MTSQEHPSMEEELAQLRDWAGKIVGAKRAGGDPVQLRKLATSGLLSILGIKDATKRICNRVEAAKEETAAAKLALESSDSTLQNLLYEKSYYEKEIHTCRSFVSKVKDEAVALMPVEDFFASLTDSPEDQELRQRAQMNEHELMKARLVHEARLRKALLTKHTQLRQTKQALAETVHAQQKTLTDLQDQLKTVQSSAKPLNAVLGSSVPLKPALSRAAELLPTPLYIAYSQLVAAKEAMQMGCTVNIIGSTDEAESYARALMGDGPDANNHSQAAPDVYKPHPLSLDLQVLWDLSYTPGAGKPPVLSVIIQYLPALKIATAHCSNPAEDTCLKVLFPGDDGSGMPIEALQHLQAGTFRYSSAQVPRPYRWVQHLCGLDFVPALPQLAIQVKGSEQEGVLSGLEAYRRQQRVVCVVQRLRQAKAGEISLNNQSSAITRNAVPQDMSMYPGNPTSIVVAWQQLQVVVGAAALPTPRAPILPPRSRSQPPNRASLPPAGAPEAAAEAAGGAVQEGAGLDDGELLEEGEQQQGKDEVEPDGLEAGQVTGDGDTSAQAAEGNSQGTPVKSTTSLQRLADEARGLKRPAPLFMADIDDDDWDSSLPMKKKLVLPSRLFKLVARSQCLEVDMTVRMYLDFPDRPPVFKVKALKQLPPAAAAAFAKGGPAALKSLMAITAGEQLGPAAVNSVCWLEEQVNVVALELVPRLRTTQTLLYQVVHLRHCLDALTKQQEQLKRSGTGEEANQALLLARQRVTGRERQPPCPGAQAATKTSAVP